MTAPVLGAVFGSLIWAFFDPTTTVFFAAVYAVGAVVSPWAVGLSARTGLAHGVAALLAGALLTGIEYSLR